MHVREVFQCLWIYVYVYIVKEKSKINSLTFWKVKLKKVYRYKSKIRQLLCKQECKYDMCFVQSWNDTEKVLTTLKIQHTLLLTRFFVPTPQDTDEQYAWMFVRKDILFYISRYSGHRRYYFFLAIMPNLMFPCHLNNSDT